MPFDWTSLPIAALARPELIGAFAAGALLLSLVLLAVWMSGRIKLARTTAALQDVERRLANTEAKYTPIRNLEIEADARTRELERVIQEIQNLRSDYATKRKIYDALVHEIRALEEKLDFAELGLYEPKFEFNSSAEYAGAISNLKEKQKSMISAGSAAICRTKWQVNGSEREGATMSNRAIRLSLRAFNNEAEVIIGKVSWKNYHASLERISKARETINKLNKSNLVEISDAYLTLKYEELRLTYEERIRKREEQEKLREERAASREEERAQREIEAEIKRAEKEEAQRREMLARATAELHAATGAERVRLNQRIAELEMKLEEAQAARARAVSMAEQTRVGHVYVISNIGSFGEQVFKVGMTRRIDPMERIQELGDASVPFPFDVHALVFTDDAPALERSLQQELENNRINRVNRRKEFFRVPLEDVKRLMAEKFPDVPFTEQADAREFFGSVSKPELETLAHAQEEERFPAAL
jgi:hypothetical protein